MQDFVHTLKHFLSNPLEIGAIAPSSPYLVRKMVAMARLKEAQLIVELGAGSGSLSGEILAHRKPRSQVFLVEKNPAALEVLKKRFSEKPGASIISGDAMELSSVLLSQGYDKADVIFSGLPFASMKKEDVLQIFKEVAETLKSDGTFIAFQYFPFTRPLFEKYFHIQTTAIELRNLPPAFVYVCQAKSNSIM